MGIFDMFRKFGGAQPPTDLQKLFDHFTSGKNLRATYEIAGAAATEPDIVEFEKQLGFRLPDEFREFSRSPIGGLFMNVREELWPPAKEYEVGPFWTFLSGFMVLGLSKDIPEWLDIRIRYQQTRENGMQGLVPFLQLMNCADVYCFTPEQKIVLWDHEDPENPRPQDITFASLVLREIEELEDRKNRKLALLSTKGD